jgi:serine protease inhibitor
MALLDSIVSANNRFAFRLLRGSLHAGSRHNVLAAPIGLAGDLALLLNGANAEAQEQILHSLDWRGISPEDIHRGHAELQRALKFNQANSNEKFVLARALWMVPPATFAPAFLAKAQQYQAIELQELPADESTAVCKVNAWISQQTEGMIDRVVSELGRADFVLTDASLLHGAWCDPFEIALTQDGPFHLCSGQDRTVPFMKRRGRFAYLNGGDFEAFALDYFHGQLFVFLPGRYVGIRNFEELLTGAHWEQWMKGFSSRPGTVELPRFKTEYREELSRALSSLGVQSLFSDFEALRPAVSHPKGARLSRVYQAIALDVHERGIKVASGTVMSGFFGALMPKPEPPFHVIVDRPFFFAVRDRRTQAILYLGVIHDPAT